MYHVYVIGDASDESPFYGSYVGVTNNMEGRWKTHAKSKYSVGTAIRTNGWTFNNMRSIFAGTSDECFAIEKKLRPLPMIGLNEAIGGKGGHTKYTNERNQKVSASLKGRKAPWIYEMMARRGSMGGKNNPNSKRWTVTSPDGVVYSVDGNLHEFCDKHNLWRKSLRENIGLPVPAPNLNTTNHKAKQFLVQKQNTTGWVLNVVS